MTHTPRSTRVAPCVRRSYLATALQREARGMLPLLVIIYSYNFVQRSLPLSWRWIERDGAGPSARKRESMCCGTRVCQCLPVSTPTYLCKSFNLTPPACRAYPERDRISKPIRIHCLDGGERAAPLDPQQPYDRVSLVGYRRPCLYRRKVLRHAHVTRVVAPEEIPAEIDVPGIRTRDGNRYMIHAYAGLRRD